LNLEPCTRSFSNGLRAPYRRKSIAEGSVEDNLALKGHDRQHIESDLAVDNLALSGVETFLIQDVSNSDEDLTLLLLEYEY